MVSTRVMLESLSTEKSSTTSRGLPDAPGPEGPPPLPGSVTPLVLPPVVVGYLLLVSFGRNGWLGKFLFDSFGVEFVFDFKGAVLAASIVSFPLMVRAIRLAFESVDRRLIQSAKTLGANPWKTFWSVVFPLSRRGLIAGCMLAFARSLGEFGATIMVAGNIAGETKTIPLFVYDQLQSPGGIGNCWPVVVCSILIAMIALLISSRFELPASGAKQLEASK